MGEYSIDEFKKKFPKLAEEIFGGTAKKLELRVEMGFSDPWRGYVPTVIDYIRRCRTVEEALEVINYLLKHGELTQDEAKALESLLRSGGIEAFGGRKEDDYYYKQARRYWQLMRAKMRKEQEKRQYMLSEEFLTGEDESSTS